MATVSDLDGFYQFDTLQPGAYAIVVHYLGWKDSVTRLKLPPSLILDN